MWLGKKHTISTYQFYALDFKNVEAMFTLSVCVQVANIYVRIENHTEDLLAAANFQRIESVDQIIENMQAMTPYDDIISIRKYISLLQSVLESVKG